MSHVRTIQRRGRSRRRQRYQRRPGPSLVAELTAPDSSCCWPASVEPSSAAAPAVTRPVTPHPELEQIEHRLRHVADLDASGIPRPLPSRLRRRHRAPAADCPPHDPRRTQPAANTSNCYWVGTVTTAEGLHHHRRRHDGWITDPAPRHRRSPGARSRSSSSPAEPGAHRRHSTASNSSSISKPPASSPSTATNPAVPSSGPLPLQLAHVDLDRSRRRAPCRTPPPQPTSSRGSPASDPDHRRPRSRQLARHCRSFVSPSILRIPARPRRMTARFSDQPRRRLDSHHPHLHHTPR